jgi:hypothetical protein
VSSHHRHVRRGRHLSLVVALMIAVIGPITAQTHGARIARAAPPAGSPVPQSALASASVGLPESDIAVDIRPSSRYVDSLVEGFGPTSGSHVDITNATVWQDAGITGADVKVGVIDFFDVTRYWDVAEHGPLPVAGVTARCFDRGSDCTGELFDGYDLGGEEHGVAVVETILDMAPEAQIFLGQATTVSDYRALIDWFASNGVTVLNRSLGSRYDGPGDGRGSLDEVAAEAVSKGILWINSGGNNGSNKYYRQQVRLSDDNWVQFGPTGTDTFLEFTGCIALAGIRWSNDWDKAPADRTDYDVFLYESPTGSPSSSDLVDSSTKSQLVSSPLEDSIDDRCPTRTFSTQNSLYLRVQYQGGGGISGDVLEILDYGSGIASFTQRAYSAAVSVVDSVSPGVVAVGAVDPASSGTIGYFSSEGPTNDGRIAPAVSAPSGFSNTVVGTFRGTSAAAAVVTGGAALLLDASLATDSESLGNLIRYLTIDRGPSGPDNLYGFGEFRLPAPPATDGIDDTPSRFVPVETPTRLLDTRPTSPVGPSQLIGRLEPGEILDLQVAGAAGVPPFGATAVAVNIVSVQPDAAGYVQAMPTLRADLGSYSNLNTDAPGQTRANLAIVPIGDGGRISLYSAAGGNLVVDLLGWFEATLEPPAAGRFVALAGAQRLLDTRVDPPALPLASGAVRMVPLPTDIDPDMVDSLVVTVTATRGSDPGWLQALPADRPDSIGATSTVNVPAGRSVANTAIVAAGPSGFAITGSFANNGSAHVVVDVIGYITSSNAPTDITGMFVAVAPNRAFNSRLTNSPLVDQQIVRVDASDAPGVSIPADASGVVWNLAVVNASRGGYLRGWSAAAIEPATSVLNWTLAGETRASAGVTAVDAGSALFRIDDGDADLATPIGHLIADVFGYFT